MCLIIPPGPPRGQHRVDPCKTPCSRRGAPHARPSPTVASARLDLPVLPYHSPYPVIPNAAIILNVNIVSNAVVIPNTAVILNTVKDPRAPRSESTIGVKPML